MRSRAGKWGPGRVKGVSVATVPHSSFRVTVPQRIVLGIHEGEVVERRECDVDVDEAGVEQACEKSNDDMADRRR